jgi:hypothetical protein
MCRSKSEGGQRCHSHANASYEVARDNLCASGPKMEPTYAYLRSLDVLASTPQGRAYVESLLAAESSGAGALDPVIDRELRAVGVAAEHQGKRAEQILSDSLKQGALLVSRNKEMGEVSRRERRASLWLKAQTIAASLVAGAAGGVLGQQMLANGTFGRHEWYESYKGRGTSQFIQSMYTNHPHLAVATVAAMFAAGVASVVYPYLKRRQAERKRQEQVAQFARNRDAGQVGGHAGSTPYDS